MAHAFEAKRQTQQLVCFPKKKQKIMVTWKTYDNTWKAHAIQIQLEA
jgi:hypothetical protein